MKTVAYIRTSTDEQVISLDVQRVKIDAMAAMRDITIDEVIVDQESAKNLARTGMRRLLALVDAGEVSTVLIAKLDRLTRSVRDLSDLMERFSKRNVALVSVGEMIDTTTAGGRMVLNLLTTVAQWERECIGERVTAAMRHQKRIGKVYCHKTPYGYEREGDKLVAVDTEQAVIRRIFSWSNAGVSLLSISRKLNGAHVATKTGGSWHASTVRAILRNSVHQGTAQAVAMSTVLADVQSALQGLGCSAQEARQLIADVDPALDFDSALRAALGARNRAA
jgi:site-specific DNA recombinase